MNSTLVIWSQTANDHITLLHYVAFYLIEVSAKTTEFTLKILASVDLDGATIEEEVAWESGRLNLKIKDECLNEVSWRWNPNIIGFIDWENERILYWLILMQDQAI